MSITSQQPIGMGFSAVTTADEALDGDAFANAFVASGRALHTLVNSAGIMAAPLHCDACGHESHFATNHLGALRRNNRHVRPHATADARGRKA